jgi:hypothetical protein
MMRFLIRSPQLVWLVLDDTACTLEYFSADRNHGVVFRGLPKDKRLMVAVSNGWQGAARYNLVGQLRGKHGQGWREAISGRI